MADSAADLEAHPHQQGGAKQTAKDLFSGAAGGVAQVLLGKTDLLMKLGDEAQLRLSHCACIRSCSCTSPE